LGAHGVDADRFRVGNLEKEKEKTAARRTSSRKRGKHHQPKSLNRNGTTAAVNRRRGKGGAEAAGVGLGGEPINVGKTMAANFLITWTGDSKGGGIAAERPEGLSKFRIGGKSKAVFPESGCNVQVK